MLFRYYLQIVEVRHPYIGFFESFFKKRKRNPPQLFYPILNIRLFILIKTSIAKIPSFQFLDNNPTRPDYAKEEQREERRSRRKVARERERERERGEGGIYG